MGTTAMENLNVKVEREEKRLFADLTRQLGTTPSNAVRMFVKAFNERQGFPFDTSRPYHMSAEALRAYDEADASIRDGSAKRYSSFDEILAEIDAEIAET